jgi:hypothetical protein
VYFPDKDNVDLYVYLEEKEKGTWRSTKVVHNCLIADRYLAATLPRKSTLTNAWPTEIRQRVLSSWERYGYR